MRARALSWLLRHARDFAENLARDLKSLRALWNWIYLALYCWITCYLTLYHAESCGSAAIYTTGGIVSSIFAAYCWSSYSEKKLTGCVPAYRPQDISRAGDAGNG